MNCDSVFCSRTGMITGSLLMGVKEVGLRIPYNYGRSAIKLWKQFVMKKITQAATVKTLVPWWHYVLHVLQQGCLWFEEGKKRFVDALYHARAVTLSAAALSCFKRDSSNSTAMFGGQYFTNGDKGKCSNTIQEDKWKQKVYWPTDRGMDWSCVKKINQYDVSTEC